MTFVGMDKDGQWHEPPEPQQPEELSLLEIVGFSGLVIAALFAFAMWLVP